MSVRHLFPYLRVRDAGRAIDYYITVFDAVELYRLVEPSGRIGHAELDFNGTTLMISDEFPEFNIKGPTVFGGTTVALHVHVDNADETLARAIAAGGKLVRDAHDQFYGERSGTVRDPWGHEWLIGHEIETVTPAEMQRRYSAMFNDD